MRSGKVKASSVRSLLDVNVLLALFDTDNVFHAKATTWLAANIEDGWASCPMTQTGFVRVLSNPKYPSGASTHQAVQMLAEATTDPHHEFWPDDVALVGPEVDPTRLSSHQQITDVYLLALAAAHNGRFVTFDQHVIVRAAPKAASHHLLILH